MAKMPTLCKACDRALFDLSVSDGGLVHCSHRGGGNTSDRGVFVVVLPIIDNENGSAGSQLHVIAPCSRDDARAKRDEILGEIVDVPGVAVIQ